jgi:putative peptidoglycan lipid II flippase
VLAKQPDQVSQLTWTFALFAPGVVGMAVNANLSRVMFVSRRLKIAAVALAGSWVITIIADVVLVQLAPARLVPAMLALGTTIGHLTVAIPMVFVTRRVCGPAAVAGARRAALAGLAACAVGAAVGLAVSLAVPAAGCAIVAFGVVAYFLDRRDLKVGLDWVRRIARRRR